MPFNGLPRCRKCGHRHWKPLTVDSYRSAKIKCQHCGEEMTTRSRRGISQMQEKLTAEGQKE